MDVEQQLNRETGVSNFHVDIIQLLTAYLLSLLMQEREKYAFFGLSCWYFE